MLGTVTIITDQGITHVYNEPIEREDVLSMLVDVDIHEVTGKYFKDGSFDLELKAKDPKNWNDLNLIFTANTPD